MDELQDCIRIKRALVKVAKKAMCFRKLNIYRKKQII